MKVVALAGLLLAGTATVSVAHAQEARDWTGFYVGGGIGYTSLKDDSEIVLFDTDQNGAFGDTIRNTAGVDAFSPGICKGAAMGRTPEAGCRVSDDQATFSARAGYDWQRDNWVVGVVGDLTIANIGDDVTTFSITPASYTFTRDLNSLVGVRGRVGYLFNNILAYGTVGGAFGDLDRSFTTTNVANSFTPSGDDETFGYQIGAGAEIPIRERWTVGVEYLYTSLPDDDFRILVGPGAAPATSPFLLVNRSGTVFRRSSDAFEFGVFGVSLNWRG